MKKPSIAEACINAREHGNKFNENTQVMVTVTSDDTSLQIVAHDEGYGIDPGNIPQNRIEKDEDGLPLRRG
jgi:anti-sigma regulatory factor (Ser/Thr protein kinase)